MKAGVNACDIANALIEMIYDYNHATTTAFTTITPYFDSPLEDGTLPEIPKQYFKLSKLDKVDIENKVVRITVNSPPIGNCGDGASVNGKAARVLSELYGIQSPSFRCSAHAADGTLIRLARSEMCVEEVKSLYNCMKPVVKHFQHSSKSKECLDSAMAMLDLSPIHLMSWCATRMAHFIEACMCLNG